MNECKVVYFFLGNHYGAISEAMLVEINDSIADWLAQGWKVLSVNPYGAGGTTAHVMVVYHR